MNGILADPRFIPESKLKFECNIGIALKKKSFLCKKRKKLTVNQTNRIELIMLLIKVNIKSNWMYKQSTF